MSTGIDIMEATEITLSTRHWPASGLTGAYYSHSIEVATKDGMTHITIFTEKEVTLMECGELEFMSDAHRSIKQAE